MILTFAEECLVSLNPISKSPLLIKLTSPRVAVAHKIYGIPQTINSANYVYFLAFQELQRIRPSREGIRIEEMVTRKPEMSYRLDESY